MASPLGLVDPACRLHIDLSARTVQVQSTEDRQALAEALSDAGYPSA